VEQKLYVLVRGDLSKSQQAVQAGHAVAEYCKQKEWGWANGTLVYLRVRDEDELREWANKVDKHCPFYEPDIGNQMTAFAVLGEHKGFDLLRLA
jgi:hypothetical protein